MGKQIVKKLGVNKHNSKKQNTRNRIVIKWDLNISNA